MTEYTPREWKLGEVCEHGSLGRKCDLCQLTDESHFQNARIAELERHCKTLANEVLESRVQLDIEPDGEASIITLRHTVTVQEDMNYQDARRDTDASGSIDFAKRLGGKT